MSAKSKAIKALLASLGTTALPEESEAAGLQTLARKLGVSLEKAAELKKLAQTIQNPELDRLRAVESVRKVKQNPSAYPKIPGGSDASVYDLGPEVLKEFSKLRAIGGEPTNPALLEQLGLGPKTHTIRTPSGRYHLQDKLDEVRSPVGSVKIDPSRSRQFDELGDQQAKYDYNPDVPEVEQLEKQRQSLMNQAFEERHGQKLEDIAEEYKNMRADDYDILEQNGVASLEDAIMYPDDFLAAKAQIQAIDRSEGIIRPFDVHSGNVGLTPDKKVQIFDTSRFEDPLIENLTPEMREQILKRDISSPEKRKALEDILAPKSESFPKASANKQKVDLNIEDNIKKATLPEYTEMLKDYYQPAEKLQRKFQEISDAQSENLKSGIENISRPGAALRSLTHAAQTGNPMIDAAKQGFLDPSQAPTGVDIAEATNLPDDAVGLKTAISTAAEFADPLDLLGLGAASKYGKIKRALGK